MSVIEKSARVAISRFPATLDSTKDDFELGPSRCRSKQVFNSSGLAQPDPSNPCEAALWTPLQKWLSISTACIVCFAVSIDSTAILSASAEVCADFHVDQTDFAYSIFLLTAWTGAAAVVPLFAYPMMEDFGTRKIYLAAFIMFLGFVAVQAVTPTFAGLVTARFFAGAAGGILQNAVDGIATDLWGVDIHRRAFSLTLYITALLAGITGGSVFGGLIANSLHWRWILYIELAIYGTLLPYTYFTLGETRPLVSSSSEHTCKSRSTRIMLSELWATSRVTLTRGIRMLFSEFIIGTFTLWSSFAFGTVFMMAASIPQVCTAIYGWSETQGGIFSSPLLVGALLGGVACGVQDLIIYPRITAKRSNPEARLYLAIPATLLGVAAGIFMYAWTALPSTHWIVLAVSLVLAGFGVTCVVIAVAVYVTDCYALNAASAISVVAFGENCFAAFLPLAVPEMYTHLGFPWAGTLLGVIALLLCAAPILLVLFGESIRSRSKYLNANK